MREAMRPIMSSPAVTCHGVIDLAYHTIPGLENIPVTFIHPLWGWIQAVRLHKHSASTNITVVKYVDTLLSGIIVARNHHTSLTHA